MAGSPPIPSHHEIPVRLHPVPRRAARAAVLALAAAPVLAVPARGQQAPELPLKHTAQPTTPAITPADLMSRLYVLADDSMQGRQAGAEGNRKATDYIAAEFRRMGLEPAGENGTFFQTIPLVTRSLDPASSLRVDGTALELGRDFLPLPRSGSALPFGRELRGDALPVIYGGRIGAEVVTPAQAAGKVVVFAPPRAAGGTSDYRFWNRAYWPGGEGLVRYRDAAAVVVASLDDSPPSLRQFAAGEETDLANGRPAPSGPLGMVVTARVAERMLGAPLSGLRPGAAGRTVAAGIRFAETPARFPARNVVAVLRGSDPALRGQYVGLSAHNDHVGTSEPVDHDSLRVFNRVMAPEGANSDPGDPTPAQWARIRAGLDSVRRIRAPRVDSVFNGADDDGSGTVTLLEVAEAMSKSAHPRRSVLFISHTAEELGLYGSQWFSDHPTVPRDSIMAVLNMDMVGRGRAEDIAGGGPNYLQIIGSRRLSTQLGVLIDSVNTARPTPMTIDYSFDAPGHPYNRYCRSDHFMYARHGIPISYFSRGYHIDYHQPGDEPQYIDYEGMSRVGGFLKDVLTELANRPQRLVVDGPLQDPNAPCRQ